VAPVLRSLFRLSECTTCSWIIPEWFCIKLYIYIHLNRLTVTDRHIPLESNTEIWLGFEWNNSAKIFATVSPWACHVEKGMKKIAILDQYLAFSRIRYNYLQVTIKHRRVTRVPYSTVLQFLHLIGFFIFIVFLYLLHILSRVSAARYWYRITVCPCPTVCLSVCSSVRPSVRRDVPVSDENGVTYFHSFFAVFSSFISIKHFYEIPTGSPLRVW